MKKLITLVLMALISVVTVSAQIKEGDSAADFKLTATDGKTYTMDSFAGKVVYIDFWATWCPPCRAEIPHMQTLEKGYEGKDVVFVSISLDRNKEDWDKWQENNKMTGVQLHADAQYSGELSKAYAIRTIPRFVLVGKDGKVINAAAPRPSSGQVQALIDKALE